MKTIAGLTAALMVAGCALFANTPAQDRTWAAYAECREKVPGNVQITRVEANGNYWYQWIGSPYGTSALEACMKTEFAKRR